LSLISETLQDVREAAKDAVHCHFEDNQMPRIIRLPTMTGYLENPDLYLTSII
jgi:hypothetical protein